MTIGEKAPDAFWTIGELSDSLGVPQHVLRYWETKFPQLKPMQRAGNRRYYRPADVALARRIHRLLAEQGYTMRGAQQALRDKGAPDDPPIPPAAPAGSPVDVERLIRLRDRLRDAICG